MQMQPRQRRRNPRRLIASGKLGPRGATVSVWEIELPTGLYATTIQDSGPILYVEGEVADA